MTSPESPEGTPFLPPTARGAATPEAIAMALRDPAVAEPTEAPYLPPAAPPKPSVASTPVFDAKAMVDAGKRKVANPVYGQIPTGTPEGRAAAEAARAKMRRKRRRNKTLGWVMTIAFIAVAAAAGYALFSAYQDDQEDREAETAATASTDAVGDQEPGAVTPLGEQAEVIEALGDVNSGARPSAGALVGAAEDAQEVIDQINGEAPAQNNIAAVDDILPTEIVAVATELQPLDGYSRYVVVVDDAARAEPLSTPGWIMRLQSFPQAPEGSPGFAVLPAVDPGEVAIAVQTNGDQVARLVVLGLQPDVRLDL